MNTHIFYHGNCPDGFTAMYVALVQHPSAVTHECHYGPAFKWPQEKSFCYIVDFCPTRAEIEDGITQGHRIIILDHHETAEAALKGLDAPNLTVQFDMKRSGAGIVWDWFYGGITGESPSMGYSPLVAYVQDRDLWRHELQYSKEINAYIMSMDYTVENWLQIDGWLRSRFIDCKNEGAAILRCKAKDTAMIIKQAQFAFIGGHKVPVVNATSLWSEVGDALLAAYPDAPFAASYCDLKGERRMWSLRSKQGENSFSVSQIASMYGGGGHRNAAGFRSGKPPVEPHA